MPLEGSSSLNHPIIPSITPDNNDIKDRPLVIEDLIHNRTTERTYDSYGNLSSEALCTGYMCSYTYDLALPPPLHDPS